MIKKFQKLKTDKATDTILHIHTFRIKISLIFIFRFYLFYVNLRFRYSLKYLKVEKVGVSPQFFLSQL